MSKEKLPKIAISFVNKPKGEGKNPIPVNKKFDHLVQQGYDMHKKRPRLPARMNKNLKEIKF